MLGKSLIKLMPCSAPGRRLVSEPSVPYLTRAGPRTGKGSTALIIARDQRQNAAARCIPCTKCKPESSAVKENLEPSNSYCNADEGDQDQGASLLLGVVLGHHGGWKRLGGYNVG